MRLNLSRDDVVLLLRGLSAEEKLLIKPGDRLVRRFRSLRERLVLFRDSVWETKLKGV